MRRVTRNTIGQTQSRKGSSRKLKYRMIEDEAPRKSADIFMEAVAEEAKHYALSS